MTVSVNTRHDASEIITNMYLFNKKMKVKVWESPSAHAALVTAAGGNQLVLNKVEMEM